MEVILAVYSVVPLFSLKLWSSQKCFKLCSSFLPFQNPLKLPPSPDHSLVLDLLTHLLQTFEPFVDHFDLLLIVAHARLLVAPVDKEDDEKDEGR